MDFYEALLLPEAPLILPPDSGTTSPVGSVLFSYTNAQGEHYPTVLGSFFINEGNSRIRAVRAPF